MNRLIKSFALDLFGHRMTVALEMLSEYFSKAFCLYYRRAEEDMQEILLDFMRCKCHLLLGEHVSHTLHTLTEYSVNYTGSLESFP